MIIIWILARIKYEMEIKPLEHYQYIFWDWNGTVIDDVQTALDAVNQMLRERGYETIDLGYYRQLMDTPIIRFYEPIFDLEKYPFDELADEFQQLYQVGKPMPFAEIPEIFQSLQKEGRHQIVLSSSDRKIIQQYAQYYHFTEYFDVILGADNLYAESKVQRAVEYMQQEQIPGAECVLIGDTVHDYEVAEKMGIECILLTSGHQAETDLQGCGCPVCHSHREILELVH